MVVSTGTWPPLRINPVRRIVIRHANGWRTGEIHREIQRIAFLRRRGRNADCRQSSIRGTLYTEQRCPLISVARIGVVQHASKLSVILANREVIVRHIRGERLHSRIKNRRPGHRKLVIAAIGGSGRCRHRLRPCRNPRVGNKSPGIRVRFIYSECKRTGRAGIENCNHPAHRPLSYLEVGATRDTPFNFPIKLG